MTNLPVHNQSVDKIIKVHRSQIILEIETDIPKAMCISSKPGRPKINMRAVIWFLHNRGRCVYVCAVYKV